MRTSYLSFLIPIIAVWSLAPSGAHAQQTEDTQPANSSGAIVADITLTKTSDLNFGDVIAGGTSGTVVLSAAASPTRSVTGGTQLGNAIGVTSATFTVGGEGASTYSITLPSSDVTITSGANSMIVNTFTSSPSGTGILSGGLQTLYVGATLSVDASQAAGDDYTGSFNVTVAYD